MMAVSLPPGFLNSSEISLETASGGMRTFGFEEFLHSVSKESMDQIRKTMLRHEKLFKEQVKMLHYLYDMQKSAMQEISKAISSQAQVLAFDSETISDRNRHLHTSIADGKPIRRSHAAQNHVESHILSQHPYYLINGFTSSSPNTSNGMINLDAKALPGLASKPRMEIDLERPPEDYMEDNEAQDVTNCYQAVDSKIFFPNLHEENDLSNVTMGCPSINGTDKKILIGAHPELSRGISRTCEPSSETKIFGALACKSKTVDQNPHEANKNHTEEFTCNNLLSVASAPVYEELSQDKLTFKGQRSHQTKTSPEAEEQTLNCVRVTGNDSSTIQVCESLESNCLISKSLSELNYEQTISGDRESHCSNAAPCPQSLLLREQYNSQKLSNSCVKEAQSSQTNSTLRRQSSSLRTEAFQRSVNCGKEDGNCSNNGSIGAVLVADEVHKDSGECTFASKNNLIGADHGESAQMSQFKEEVRSKREESAQLVNDGIKSLIQSSGQGVKSDDIQTNEKTRDGVNEEEASESVAARILLSFVPDRSNSTSEEQEQGNVKDMEVERRRKNTDAISHERKRSLRTRRTINYYDGGLTDETIKLTKSFQGRRSLRRP